jgi:phosphoribosyl 1,2-cyclic phosphodiesterase
MHKVISTGSQGNAVIYHNEILVDCGVPFALIKPYVSTIKLILLTHQHGDHFNITTLQRIFLERPGIRIGCGVWMVDKLEGFRHLDIYQAGTLYYYNDFQISPVILYHDVPNFGYRIFKGNHKTIHCTDTAHLDGITAKNYDLYALEHNYNEETIDKAIESKQLRGEFVYQRGAKNSHLSEQQAQRFIFENKGEKYEVLRLHESKSV